MTRKTMAVKRPKKACDCRSSGVMMVIAAAACVREMIRGDRRPGLLPQALYVDPDIFFGNLRNMGAKVEESVAPA